GAAGTIGLARFVNAEAGNPATLLVTGLVMVSGIVTNASPVTLSDVTPIARLSGEYEVIVVPASSPYTSLAELVAAFRADPRGVSWGGGSAGGTDEILVRLLAEAVGVPRDGVNYIAYSGGGQALAAVLGGHVSAGVSGLGEFTGQLESGDLRALAISAPERIVATSSATDVASKIPTFREMGYDVVLMNWRGVVAAPGISRDERQSLEQTIVAMTRSPAWQEALVRNGWTDLTLAGAAFARFVVDETRRVAPLVAAGRGPQRTDWFEWFVLAGLGTAVLVSATQLVRQRASVAARATARANRNALVLVLAGLTVQAVLLRPAGFIAASVGMFVLVARAFGSPRPLRDVVIGLAFAVAVFLTFARGLGINLPAGPFG
ncbi:MAG TPA: tripartite tricarboxylate transporter substrate-binding protein, partial [Gemmatimonadaceae bacterium]